MGPNCMISTVDKQLTNGVIAYWCNNSGCGPVKGAMSVQLTYAICAFSSAEMNQRDLLLDKNGLESPFSVMSQCPNGKCGKYIFREDESKNILKCGSPDCDPVATFTALLNEKGTTKTISGVSDVYSVRMCPGKACFAINEHKDNCLHMTCSCGHQYCHICLKDWKGHSSANCVKQPKQVVNAALLGFN